MIELMRKHIIPAAFSLLPERMTSTPAIVILLAIGLQESRFMDRRQIRGPARGFFQFEEAGGVNGVLSHVTTRRHVISICDTLRYIPATKDVIYRAMADNDILAACMARLLLWTHPAPLPGRSTEDAWEYYLRTWRPGKPHREIWDENFNRAWESV